VVLSGIRTTVVGVVLAVTTALPRLLGCVAQGSSCICSILTGAKRSMLVLGSPRCDVLSAPGYGCVAKHQFTCT
jgi:hypothetical protein